jgi:Sulfotransferase family
LANKVLKMIVSHRYRFVFLKTAKTAGTSIEIALSKFAGPLDIVTACTPADEELRKALGYVAPQNYEVPLGRIKALAWRYATGQRLAFYNHMGAETVRQLLGAKIWSSYFKFCVERNPWDKVVSAYYFDRLASKAMSLSEYVQSGAASNLAGYNLYTIGGEIAVDKIYFYEDLENALKDLAERCGIAEPIVLPRAKAQFRPADTSYRMVLTKKDAEKIAQVYAREIAMFGYSW